MPQAASKVPGLINGVINGAINVEQVVIVTDNATFPFARKVITFEATPPGQAPIKNHRQKMIDRVHIELSSTKFPKRRRVTLTIRSDLMEQAKALKLNVSQAAEQGIEAAIKHAMGQASGVHVVGYN